MFKDLSLTDIRNAVVSNVFTVEGLVEYYLNTIEENKDLNIFLEVYTEEALASAKRVDTKIKKNTAGRLAGAVIGIKDIFHYAGHKLECASKILEGNITGYTATVVQRLLDEDAIIIGRQNCDEFAMGSSNEKSAFGSVKNPIDKSKVPGGSSGGSTAAVKAGMCLASLGTDSGGSVRQPASFCGVIGLKPTYSRISRYGVVPFAESFDTVGIVTNTIEDNALLLEIIAGNDDLDQTVSRKVVPEYTENLHYKEKKKIGYFEEALTSEGVSDVVKSQTHKAINKLREAGYEIEPYSFKYLDYLVPTYSVLSTAEASANLSVYKSETFLEDEDSQRIQRTLLFGEEAFRRIMLGTFVLDESNYQSFYIKAQKVRRFIKEETDSLLTKYDFLMMPTVPTTAFDLEAKNQDPLAMYMADIFTVQANLAGVPAITLPNGIDESGLPIGIQFVTKAFDEGELLCFSKMFLELGN